MKLLPMERLGAHERDGGFDFGLLLPWVSADSGNRVSVKIIHEHDQFLQAIQPLEIALTHTDDSEYGDYWSGRVEVDPALDRQPGSSWGQTGRYVYRYVVHPPHGAGPIDRVIDPFAREFGVGKLSAITFGYEDHQWSEQEAVWRTPALEDLVVYELMISEFACDIDGAIARLDYLADLGVSCLELMPVANVGLTVDWGYLPIGYFGVDERFGKRWDLQRLIDAAHARGLAVVVDAVYAHASADFPYADAYRRLHYHENPVMGPFAGDAFGVSADFGRAFTRDFFSTANLTGSTATTSTASAMTTCRATGTARSGSVTPTWSTRPTGRQTRGGTRVGTGGGSSRREKTGREHGFQRQGNARYDHQVVVWGGSASPCRW